jgi:Zn-dependent protease
MKSTARLPQLRILGFPTQIRPGFIVFIALVVLLYGGSLGLWVGASLTVFTLIHELGHALAARANGCVASISLNFMMAYAAYEPTRPLTWRQRIGIALAGSSAQIAAGLLILAIMRVNPFDYSAVTNSEASAAIWWSAIILGAINLVPLVPLDGGAVVSTLLEQLFPRRGRWIMLRASVAITGAMVLLTFTVDRLRGFLPFALFLLFIQYQTLNADRLVRQGSAKPFGEPMIDAQVASQLVDIGRIDEALRYAREAFLMNPHDQIALQAARAAAAQNDVTATVSWLHAARTMSIDPLSLFHGVNSSIELQDIRHNTTVESEIASIALLAQQQ